MFTITAWGGELAITPGTYDIEAQTVMPHLEEMRRISTHETRCLDGERLTAIFPVLRQRAFTGCTLGYETPRGERFEYVLVCQSARVATGTALIDAAATRIAGDLQVKMGGKNMTFSQHVEAVRRGACGETSAARATAEP